MPTLPPQEFSWKTQQNLTIYAVEWPVKNPRAVIGLIHGLGEHCRRYDHLAQFFQENNIAVIGYDRQGYGRSEGRRGYVEKFGYYLDTVGRLLIECETRHPDRPVYLYGHSLGGGILLNYVIKRNPNVAGIICSAAYIRLGFPPPALKVALGNMMRKIWPTFTQPSGLNLKHLSRSPQIAPEYAADPYTHDRLTANAGMEMLETGEWLDQWEGKLNVPTLLMHGSADKITAHDGSKDFANRVQGDDVTFKSWPGLFHELHNEPEQREVMEYVLAWLNERIAGATEERKLKSI